MLFRSQYVVIRDICWVEVGGGSPIVRRVNVSVGSFGRVLVVVVLLATVGFGSLPVSAHGDHDHLGDGYVEPEQGNDNIVEASDSGVGVSGGVSATAAPEFSAVEPTRVLDTRATGRVTAGSVVEVELPSDIRSVSDVSAAVLTVTVVKPAGWGFVTVFPCGSDVPGASNVNYTAGVTRAATVFSKLGGNNTVCVYSYADTDLLVDVTGVFYDTSAFTALTPFRLADSRDSGRVTANTSLTVPVRNRGGVAADATHAVVTLTAVEASGWGFLTAYACGASVPEASNVNYDTGWTVANQAIVPLSTSGELCVYTWADTDVLVDVVGYFTGIDAIAAPTRIADTRPGSSERYTSRALRPNTWNNTTDPANAAIHRIIMVDASQIGDRVSSIYANITVIPNTGTAGFVAPIPCGATSDSDAGSSVVNYNAAVIANSAVLDVNRAGYTCILVRDYNQSAADIDIAVDVIGWTPTGWDTDSDGIEDTDEIPGCETTTDCDNNGTPDNQEPTTCDNDRTCNTFNDRNDADSDDDNSDNPGNSITDPCFTDLNSKDCLTSLDLDNDGVPDDFEITYHPYTWEAWDCTEIADCDGDGLLDFDEPVWCAVVIDCDGDGVLDGDEEPGCVIDDDCDHDWLFDDEDPQDHNQDIDGDGVLDGRERGVVLRLLPEEKELSSDLTCVFLSDCDGDGQSDFCWWNDDPNHNYFEIDIDCDRLDDFYDEPAACVGIADCDADGIPDFEDGNMGSLSRIPATQVGRNLYVHDYGSLLPDGLFVLRYQLNWCDATDVYEDFPGIWNQPLYNSNGGPLTYANAWEYLTEDFPRIAETLTDGFLTVEVVEGQIESADPTTGECNFKDVDWRPDEGHNALIFWGTHGQIRPNGSSSWATPIFFETWLPTSAQVYHAQTWYQNQGMWIGESLNDPQTDLVFGHEFGHTLGFGHSWHGREYPWEYSSEFDLMGWTDELILSFAQLLSIGAIRPSQVLFHESGSQTATIEAHNTYRGSVAPDTSIRGIVATPPEGDVIRGGAPIALGIEAARTETHQGVKISWVALKQTGDSRLITGGNGPLAAFEWEDSFVQVGETKTFLGLEVTVHDQTENASTRVTVSGEMVNAQGFFFGVL